MSEFRERPRRPSVRVVETENDTQSTFSVTGGVHDNLFDSGRGSEWPYLRRLFGSSNGRALMKYEVPVCTASFDSSQAESRNNFP